MNILVDTSVWSLALRHQNPNPSYSVIIEELSELIRENRAVLAGPIVQELLSGVKNTAQFIKLEKALKPFDLIAIEYTDYINAAKLYNQCRGSGVQGSHIDFLLCAIAIHHKLSIFTVDKDFQLYSQHINLTLHDTRVEI